MLNVKLLGVRTGMIRATHQAHPCLHGAAVKDLTLENAVSITLARNASLA